VVAVVLHANCFFSSATPTPEPCIEELQSTHGGVDELLGVLHKAGATVPIEIKRVH
jgi:hypothetical protein